MMRLKLVVDVPESADTAETLMQLATHNGRGMTITMASGYRFDVDLVDAERYVPMSLIQEVTS